MLEHIVSNVLQGTHVHCALIEIPKHNILAINLFFKNM